MQNAVDVMADLEEPRLEVAGLVERLAETPGPEHRDLRPVLEYEAPRAQFQGEWSRLLTLHDERRKNIRSSGLLLSRWLSAPPRRWTKKTSAQVSAYHERHPGLADLNALAGQAERYRKR